MGAWLGDRSPTPSGSGFDRISHRRSAGRRAAGPARMTGGVLNDFYRLPETTRRLLAFAGRLATY